jgi:phage gpG-like protein
MNLLEAIARFAAAQAAVKAAEHESLEAAAQMVENRAKGYIGHPHAWWPPLTDETLKRKDGVNTPLLESGAMRNSIEHTVEFPSAFVGSNSDTAVFQELGTSRGLPPRSFLGHAAMESGEEIAKMTAKIVGGAIGASLGGHSIEHKIFELLREVAHEVMDVAEPLMPDETEAEKARRR